MIGELKVHSLHHIAADEGNLLFDPVHFIAVCVARDLQRESTAIADPANAGEHVIEISARLSQRLARDFSIGEAQTIFDMDTANAIAIGSKLFARDIAQS